MALRILGINHRTAPVSIREQIAFGPDQLQPALMELTQLHGVDEGLIVSTCNRTELYCASDDEGAGHMREWLKQQRRVGETLENCLYSLTGDEAVRHAFAVACGLDSAILGEPQILGQMKEAYRSAHRAGTTGPLLNFLFQQSFSVAKQVRTDTDIGASAVSIAYAAVSLARQIFAGFERHSALLIGAGQTIELVARHLVANGMHRIIIANRNVHRARDLAAPLNGFAISLGEIPAHLEEADIIISSTASRKHIVKHEEIVTALKARRRRPIFIVDIAVPRDIEPSVADLSDVYLYTVDDLQNVIEENLKSRQAAARQAEEIISAEVARFVLRQRTLGAVPAIRDIRKQAEQLREAALAKARRGLAAGKDADQIVAELAHILTNKLMHRPSVSLREAAEEGDLDLIRIARGLYGVDLDDDDHPGVGEP